MRIARIPAIALAVLLLMPLQAAVSAPKAQVQTAITNLMVQMELFENSTANVVIKATLTVDKNYTKEVKSIVFPVVPFGRYMVLEHVGIARYFNISSNIEVKKIEYEAFAEALLVKFREPVKPGSTTTFRFFFSLKPDTVLSKVKGSNNFYTFAYMFYKPNVTVISEKAAMKVFLPPSSAVYRTKSDNLLLQNDPLSRRLVAVWKPFGAPSGDGWNFQLEFFLNPGSFNNNITVVTPPSGNEREKRSNITLLELVIIILASNVITGSLVYFVLRRKIAPPEPGKWMDEGNDVTEDDILKAYDLLEKFDKDEEIIVRIIAERGGRIEQKELPDLTGFSKSKVSRVLKRLDSVGAVRRVSSGKTKIVELNPAILTVLNKGQ